ncbi:gliding motility-associated C-terminal domain-containing protein [Mangrovimonas sp. TPBH4]|uniref:T9SS type B sorting domain-containing protein n=1 Tax=Mangrovimonas sp. TPBH4 TaxID=1645914 RepID=UPI0006B687C5|nr:gliding motility-associated C-terminal domain-containing protein [Mangrovimonas sp. TPBH4]
MTLNHKRLALFFVSALALIGCTNNDNNQTEEELYLCCKENALAANDVNNLDQNAGTITPFPYMTPDGDGYNDFFIIENIEEYPNNTVTIYDMQDNLVFSAENYNNSFDTSFWGVNENLPNGSYRYKIIVEDEATYIANGYLCLIIDFDQEPKFISSECAEVKFDPMIGY